MSSVTNTVQHFLGWIMSIALGHDDGKVNIGGRNLPVCGLPMKEML